MNKRDKQIATTRILVEMLNDGYTAYKREDGVRFKIGDDIELWSDTFFTKLSGKGTIKEFCEFGGELCIRTFDSNVPHSVDCLRIAEAF